jgi:hypothetical protein
MRDQVVDFVRRWSRSDVEFSVRRLLICPDMMQKKSRPDIESVTKRWAKE